MKIVLQFDRTTFEGVISLYEKSPYIIRGTTKYLCGKSREAFIFLLNKIFNFKKVFFIYHFNKIFQVPVHATFIWSLIGLAQIADDPFYPNVYHVYQIIPSNLHFHFHFVNFQQIIRLRHSGLKKSTINKFHIAIFTYLFCILAQ